MMLDDYALICRSQVLQKEKRVTDKGCTDHHPWGTVDEDA